MGLFKTYSEKELKRIEPIKKKTLDLEPVYEAMDDAELKAQTGVLKKRLADGETLDAILPDAFAVCREAMWRIIGIKPYPVQIIGGVVLHQGRIAEMKTGEGKTFVAALPAYLNALTGGGVHIVTVNDYLAKYGSELIGRVFRFLGMNVGLIVHEKDDGERRASYAADITYGTNNEFGFDYLRDNMRVTKNDKVQRQLNFAIVDEVDSILIDEARTPLIISGRGDKSTDLYVKADRLAQGFKKVAVVELDSKEDHDEYDGDYIVDEKARTATLLPSGVKKAERYFGIENLMDSENLTLLHHVNQAIKARGIMKIDVDYVSRGGEIIIVDEFTGRLMFGRRFNEGLHQAIEAKENVKIKNESKTLATITFQNYFRLYSKLSGMTGTAMTEEAEFRGIYSLDVVEIPTHKLCIRTDLDDRVYKSENGKFAAVVEQIEECHAKGQPVLVGTVSVEKSEHLSKMLRRKGLKHEVLNAVHHAREAEIVAQAGKKGAITITTNMAGRGTDIMLGGNAEHMARSRMKKEGWDEDTVAMSVSLKEQTSADKHDRILETQKEYENLINSGKSAADAKSAMLEKGFDENDINLVVKLESTNKESKAGSEAREEYRKFLKEHTEPIKLKIGKAAAKFESLLKENSGLGGESFIEAMKARGDYRDIFVHIRGSLLETANGKADPLEIQKAASEQTKTALIQKGYSEKAAEDAEKLVKSEAAAAEQVRKAYPDVFTAAVSAAEVPYDTTDARPVGVRKEEIIDKFITDKASEYLSGKFPYSVADAAIERVKNELRTEKIKEISREYGNLTNKYKADMTAEDAEKKAGDDLREKGYARDIIAEAVRRFERLEMGAEEEKFEESKKPGKSEFSTESVLNARKRFDELYAKFKSEIAPEAVEVKDAGGLFILGTERHESRRIDNQLRGRSGRQGDPGESRFFISLEDDLMRLFGGERIQRLMDTLKIDEDMPIQNRLLTRTIESSQKKIEARNFSIRKNVLEFDDVMSQQRSTIYKQRGKVLDGEDVSESIKQMITETVRETVNTFCQGDIADDWNLTGLRESFAGILTKSDDFRYTVEQLNDLSKEEIENELLDRAMKRYEEQERSFTPEIMREVERSILLKNVDTKWMDHIDAMSDLKQGIYLRTMGGGRDPVVEYRHEGFAMYDEMIAAIREDTVRMVLSVRVRAETPPQRVQVMRPDAPNAGSRLHAPAVKKAAQKAGPNDPCPCGSGKKYKKCCGN